MIADGTSVDRCLCIISRRAHFSFLSRAQRLGPGVEVLTSDAKRHPVDTLHLAVAFSGCGRRPASPSSVRIRQSSRDRSSLLTRRRWFHARTANAPRTSTWHGDAVATAPGARGTAFRRRRGATAPWWGTLGLANQVFYPAGELAGRNPYRVESQQAQTCTFTVLLPT